MYKIFQLSLLLTAALLTGKKKKKSESSRDWEQRQIDAYLSYTYTDTTGMFQNGIYVLSYTPKGGTDKLSGDTSQWVQFDYTGMSLNGTKFQETDSLKSRLLGTFSYATHYIPVYAQYWNATMLTGLYIALGKMCVNDEMKVLLPSWLAYGSSGSSNVGGNTPIILDLTLRKIVDNPREHELKQVEEVADNGFVALLDSTGTELKGIYIKYVDTVPRTDTTRYLKNDGVDKPNLKYSGYFLDTFLLDSNVGAVARAHNRFPSTGSDTSKYASFFSYTYGSAEVISAFNAALWRITPGSTIEIVFTSDWGYGAMGNTSGTTLVYPYTPLRYWIRFDGL
jgi:FKBP-type peptidyl-prolyl cis-trans isomerase 2